MVVTGMSLNIGSKLDDRFLRFMESIPTELKKISGISELDSFELTEKFFDTDVVADASIDANANLQCKSPVSFQSEVFKPQLKYMSFYYLWKQLLEKYDLDSANKCINACISGGLYFHDSVKSLIPYCFAFDTSFLMVEGRPYGWLPSVPPKRSNSFVSQVIETVMDLSQSHAGAIGIANLLVNLAYYSRKERMQLRTAIQNQIDFATKASEQDFWKLQASLVNSLEVYMAGLGFEEATFQGTFGIDEVKAQDYETLKEKAFAQADSIYDKYIQNLLQNFVHIMHNTFRVGGDSPFTNISLFDKYTFQTVFAEAKYPDFSDVTDNYQEVNRIQKIFVEFFYTGAPNTGKNYRFPVVTANIKKDANGTIADKEFFNYIILKNKLRGAFNIHIGEKIASCCRLTSDLSKLKNEIRTDSFGNGGLSIGSHRVVAINLHRVALVAKITGVPFKNVLEDYVSLSEKLLVVHKELLLKKIKQGFLTFFNIGWEKIEMFFSTIGYTGLIDAYSVLVDKSVDEVVASEETLEDYVAFADMTLTQLDILANALGEKHPGFAFNVEEIPAENASPKMAQSDNYLFKHFKFYKPVSLLSNQMIPLYCNVPLLKRLEISGRLMNKVSGGSILHLNLTEEVTDEAYLELVQKMVSEYNIPHFAINVGSTTCVNKHTTPGIYERCPVCDAAIETYTIRVVGFNTDTSAWSKERRKEFIQRQFYGAADVTAKNILLK